MNYKYWITVVSVIVFSSHIALTQEEDDFDFSDLDKVEQEEFGDTTSEEDSADFDLETEPETENVDAQDELEKEIDELDGPAASEEAPATVDLEKELEQQIEEEPATAETLPALETPQPQVEESVPAPEQVAEVVSEPQITDEPNEKLEARLNRIYERFMSERTSDEEWLQIAGEKATEVYTVQKGDSLWDISVTFFGNGFFWPKIWQLNDDITNPHIIQPGRVIRFTPGTLNDAPTMQVVDGVQEEAVVAEGAPPAPEEVVFEEPEIPPPDKVSRAVLKTIPPSLPNMSSDETGFDDSGFAIDKQKAAIAEPTVAVSAYLSEQPPVTVGEIVGTEMEGAEAASQFEYVFAKLQNVRVGETLTAYTEGRRVEFDGSKVGTPIELQGRLKVLERVNDEDLYKVMVEKNIGQVRVGNKLTRESIPTVTMSKEGRAASVSGSVVGGQFEHNRKVLGLGNIIYVDVGSNSGLNQGDIVTVFRNETVRNKKINVTNNTRVIGKIKIAKTTGTKSTGVVVESTDVIRPGDILGTAMASNRTNEMSEPTEDIIDDTGDIEGELDSSEEEFEF